MKSTQLTLTIALLILVNSAFGKAADDALLDDIKNFDESSLPATVSFNRHIRPILSNNCFACHGNDKTNRKADLSFANYVDATTQRSDGFTAIVPGNPEASEILKRMAHPNIADRMPPKSTEKTLSAKEILLIKRWIAQGAEYEKHWSYNVPKRVDVPNDGQGWAKNAIDRFVARKHRTQGLVASVEADKRTLIRRLSLDLLGLPPSREDINEFVSNDQPDAYESLVNKLLDSTHFGERMAIDWLDVVRYADTWGYHGDNEREVWPYRDYVINAFNENMPFSEFTREQIAGDLMPEKGFKGLTASTYNMLINITQEGGAQDKEYLVRSMVDRVTNIGTTWLGSTTGCAVCHDHKFDPYSAKDIYSLGAFFSDIKENGFWGSSRIGSKIFKKFPIEFVGSEQERETFNNLFNEYNDYASKRIAKTGKPAQSKGHEPHALNSSLLPFSSLSNAVIEKPLDGYNRWLESARQHANTSKTVWHVMNLSNIETMQDSAVIERNAVKSKWIKTEKPERYLMQGEGNFPNKIRALRFDFLSLEDDPTNDRKAKGVPFSIKNVTAAIIRPDGTRTQTQVEYHVLGHSLKPVDFGYYSIPRAKLEVNYNHNFAIGNREGLTGKNLILFLEKPLDWQDGDTFVLELELAWRFGLDNMGPTILPSTQIKVTDVSELGPLPDDVINLVKQQDHSALEKEFLNKYYNLFSPEAVAVERNIMHSDIKLMLFGKEYPRTWVTKTREKPREVRVLPRGDWMDESGELVTPAIPAFLGELEIKDRPVNRLDLANWLISPENPLTARVMVNRLWKTFFGIGLSKVLDDLGSQGEWPTHPDLLDWLAVEFIESGWDVKHIVRLMVLSATYRQSSVVTEDVRAKDVHNRYYARQAQVRLPAEVIRDNVLAIANLLNRQVGGASVRPYQPEGYLSDLEFPKRYWRAERDDNQYRRGLYTFWQRTRLHPMMHTFDAPARSEGLAQRVVSNTPLQALTLLNDPSFVEAARVFGSSILQHTGSTEEKVDWALETALARPTASQQELDTLVQAYTTNLRYFRENESDADALLAKGNQIPPTHLDKYELAAWTSIARIILNLHETVTRL